MPARTVGRGLGSGPNWLAITHPRPSAASHVRFWLFTICHRLFYKALEAADQRGHLHHAFFKEAMLGRFYAICNCCVCCCGALQAYRNGIPMLASSGYVGWIDPEKWPGCGLCMAQCPTAAITRVRDHSRSEPLEIDQLHLQEYSRP
jgi:ferredoxin